MSRKKPIIKLHQLKASDARDDASTVRFVEMTIDAHAKSQGVVLQFFNDFELYGISEALNYVRSYVSQGYYREEILDEIESLEAVVRAAVEGGEGGNE